MRRRVVGGALLFISILSSVSYPAPAAATGITAEQPEVSCHHLLADKTNAGTFWLK